MKDPTALRLRCTVDMQAMTKLAALAALVFLAAAGAHGRPVVVHGRKLAGSGESFDVVMSSSYGDWIIVEQSGNTLGTGSFSLPGSGSSTLSMDSQLPFTVDVTYNGNLQDGFMDYAGQHHDFDGDSACVQDYDQDLGNSIICGFTE